LEEKRFQNQKIPIWFGTQFFGKKVWLFHFQLGFLYTFKIYPRKEKPFKREGKEKERG